MEHYGEERRESQVEEAERVVREELRRRRWSEAALGRRAKGDPEKVKMALRLRKETVVTVSWIAARSSDLDKPLTESLRRGKVHPFGTR